MAVKADSSLLVVLGDTPPEKLDQPCQDEQLCAIARYVTDWLTVAPFLGVSPSEEKEILGNWPRNTAKQKIDFFRKWQEKCGRKATYRLLCKGFWKAGEVSLIERVCELICKQESSFESSFDQSDDQDAGMPHSLGKSTHSKRIPSPYHETILERFTKRTKGMSPEEWELCFTDEKARILAVVKKRGSITQEEADFFNQCAQDRFSQITREFQLLVLKAVSEPSHDY